jgi:4-hydroxybenzoate polyprenyltransferase
METENTTAPQVTVTLVEGRKSLGLALILTFFFGPFGVLYVSALWGLVMIVLGAAVCLFTLGLGIILVWPLSMILAGVLVWARNGRLKRSAEQAGR